MKCGKCIYSRTNDETKYQCPFNDSTFYSDEECSHNEEREELNGVIHDRLREDQMQEV